MKNMLKRDGLYVVLDGDVEYGDIQYKGTSLKELENWWKHCAYYNELGSSSPDSLILVWNNGTQWCQVPQKLPKEREQKLVDLLLQLQKKKYWTRRY